MLVKFGRNDREIGLWCAEDRTDSSVRLLIGSPARACEFRWDLLAGELIDGFREGLAGTAAVHLPLVATRHSHELDLYVLEAKAKELGQSWVGK